MKIVYILELVTLLLHLHAKEIEDEEPYYSTKILFFSFIWAGLAALHKASTLKWRLYKVKLLPGAN